MTTPKTNQRIELRGDLLVEEIDGECVILDLERNVYFGLNPTALIIWRGLERGDALDVILSELVATFDAPEGVLRADLDGFVSGLLEQRLAHDASFGAPT